MGQQTADEVVARLAREHGVPGVAFGVWDGERARFACHGVTSVDNPLPVDPDTLFVLGSVTKTFTATAVMCLVERGEIDLGAPVQEYVPELELDGAITVQQLLNHTSGLDWGFTEDTGEGDDALARYVAGLAALPMVARPGERVSYSQAGYNLAGRIVEKVTGLTYERAVTSLLLEPLGLEHSLFMPGDVMTRRFSVGHNPGPDGAPAVARLWRRWRGENPGGGLVSSAADQLRWARFHLGDGAGILPAGLLHGMRRPTAVLRGSSLGDAIGTGWFLRSVDGVDTIGHAGSANGQFAELCLVPERDFAVVALANAGPDGVVCNRELVRWALEQHLGLVEREPEPLPFDEAVAGAVTGTFENEVMTLAVAPVDRMLRADCRMKAHVRAASDRELPPDYPPFALGLLPGDGYVVLDGGMAGLRGYFVRDGSGTIEGVDLAGRLFRRVP